ncbi:YHS domain-containing protein (fragment) [Candidatus Nitrosotenuis uzonensis]|uniref:YHS domain-containing protein n=1 Tax=Candidatus Nitrosotenuis uzonensis TaxID=1407055 RepID=A0A812F3R9_9ARCH
MEVDEKKSPTTKFNDKTYYFCCPSCKSMFDKNPAKYT